MLKNIFNRRVNNEPFEIAGVMLGGFTAEVTGIITLGNLGDYYMASYNNSSGTCSFVTLNPIDSAEEMRWLTTKQVASLYNFLEKDFGGTFGNWYPLDDTTDCTSFESNDCEILLIVFDTDGPMVRPGAEIRHIDAFEQIQREISTFSSYDDWLENRKIR